MKYKAVIRQNGKTATGIPVPPEIVEALGAGKKPPVRVTVNGYTYRTSIATVSGEYMMSLSAENRAAAGVKGGDAVEVTVEVDTQPREVELPPDFAAALEADAEAKRFFEGLSYSNKRRFVLPIQDAKSAETRQRRIEKTIVSLREGKM
jgi:hypothetical protein